MTSEFQTKIISSGAMGEWNMIVSDIVEKVDVVFGK